MAHMRSAAAISRGDDTRAPSPSPHPYAYQRVQRGRADACLAGQYGSSFRPRLIIAAAVPGTRQHARDAHASVSDSYI